MPKEKIPAKLRTLVLSRDGFKCKWCGRSSADGITLHVDHVTAEAFGGKTTEENLATLCSDCNLGKGAEYFGSYLLMSVFKVPDLDAQVKLENTGSHIGPDRKMYDGIWWRYTLKVYVQEEGGRYDYEHIDYPFLVHNAYTIATDASSKIKLAEKKQDAFRQFKMKLRDFLFERKGYLTEIDEMLVVKPFQN